MRYVVLVLGLLILLAASIALVVRSFQTGAVVEARTETKQPAPPAPADSDRINSVPAATPAPAGPVREERIPLAAQAPNLAAQPPQPAQVPESSPALAARTPADERLDLTAAEIERVRHVLLTHNIMQLEEAGFPLRVGAVVPENVNLSPLPIELSDAVPAYTHYSYVILQNQIAIVVTGKREIRLLIPVPAPA